MRPDLRQILREKEFITTGNESVKLSDSAIDKIMRFMQEAGYVISETVAERRDGETVQQFQDRMKNPGTGTPDNPQTAPESPTKDPADPAAAVPPTDPA